MSRTFVTSRRFLSVQTLTGPRFRRQRRTVGRLLRHVGDALFWIAGAPLSIGRGMMWLGGRLRGYAYQVELDR